MTIEEYISDLRYYNESGLGAISSYGAGEIADAFEGLLSEYNKVTEKLALYDDAEKHGRLIVLPCKIGDTVYINTPSGATLTEVVDSVTKPQFRTKTVEGLRGLDFEFCDYGKTVFLSHEEAEKALEGMK